MRLALALAALVLVFGSGFSVVRSTNFGGFDEWLVVSLTSQGIVSMPYANRPLALASALPGVLGLPSSLAGYLLVHQLSLLLAGLVVFMIVRRLAPECPLLALLASAVALVWAPLDPHRLNALNNLQYSGATLAALVALLLALEWARTGWWLAFAGGVAAAFVAVRMYEGTLGLLSVGGAVLLIALGGSQRRRPLWSTLVLWESAMAALTALAIVPLLDSGGTYQLSALRLNPTVFGVLARLTHQFRWELGPLAPVRVSELSGGRVVVAVATMVVAVLSMGGFATLPRRRTLSLIATGLLIGASGWLLMLLSPSIDTPQRMQGFSAPGFGLALGALAMLTASFAPKKAQTIVVVALASWIVAVGTARTLEMQRTWDHESFYDPQNRLLRDLTVLAPDLRPGTLVVLLDGQGVFPPTFTFRHAVSLVYGGRADGLVMGGHDFLYPATFASDSILSSPLPAIRGPWRSPEREYGYDSVVVVRAVQGHLALEERWPAELPPARGAAHYRPLDRILTTNPAGGAVVPGP